MPLKMLFVVAGSLFLLSGCASYRASALSELSGDSIVQTDPIEHQKDLIVTAKAFNRGECKKFLDRDVLEKGYQPVQIYIRNNSDKSYLFSPSRVSLSIARSEEVAQRVYTSTVGRVVGYGVGALFLWPLAIPAVVDGVKSVEANEALYNDFLAKEATDQLIAPYSHFNKIIFVPRSDYRSFFTITLIEAGTNQPRKFNMNT